MMNLDDTDRRILVALQTDSDRSLDEIGELVGLSRNACWRRIRMMEKDGVIRGRVALLDPAKLGFGLTVFIQVRTSQHASDWLKRFRRATLDIPEIQGAYRMTGDLDYLIKARVRNMKEYRDLLGEKILSLPGVNGSRSYVVMEEVKESMKLPLFKS